MRKEYLFNKKLFSVRIIYAGIIAAIVFVFGIYNITRGSSMKYLFMLICLLCVYTIFTNFISISYPEKIVIEEDEISFSAFNKSHVYSKKELTSFKIKEQQLAKKMYIRVNKPSLLKGRYWIDLTAYNDYRDLQKNFLGIEEVLHPNSLKSNVKKNNAIYEERKRKKKNV